MTKTILLYACIVSLDITYSQLCRKSKWKILCGPRMLCYYSLDLFGQFGSYFHFNVVPKSNILTILSWQFDNFTRKSVPFFFFRSFKFWLLFHTVSQYHIYSIGLFQLLIDVIGSGQDFRNTEVWDIQYVKNMFWKKYFCLV